MFKKTLDKYEGLVRINFNQAKTDGEVEEKGWNYISDKMSEKILVNFFAKGLIYLVSIIISSYLFYSVDVVDVNFFGWSIIGALAFFAFYLTYGLMLMTFVVSVLQKDRNPYKGDKIKYS